MALRHKISILISILFSLLFGVAAFSIYSFSSEFREDEFRDQLKNKALTSIKLLVDVKEIDQAILKAIDQNSINKLYDEKTLIFDANFNLIYSSLDDTKITWNVDDLKSLKENKDFFKKEGAYEIFGLFYDSKEVDYYAIISARDEHGNRKLSYLMYLLIITYLAFTALCGFVTYYAVKKLLNPLTIFLNRIKNINENNLDSRVEVKNNKDEIDLLAIEFNQMLQRIDVSYQKQKDFTANASHEMRTPIARISAQIENRLWDSDTTPEMKQFLTRLLNDVGQLTELINSLIILSKVDSKHKTLQDTQRVDELIYESIEELNRVYPEFKISFDIIESEELSDLIELKGNRPLLLIAFRNLLKNACVYSDNAQAKVTITMHKGNLNLIISNTGVCLTAEEQAKLFQAFMRGSNAKNKNGLGLGLRIVQRILQYHKASISYMASDNNLNTFSIIFSH